MLTDVTIDTLHVALRGLAERQRATADNVSNLETPMFLARKVEFESSLRRALLFARRRRAGDVPFDRPRP